MNVGIVGLGLMGGSFGLALRKYVNTVDKIYGVDHNKEHQSEALNAGLVDAIITSEELHTCDVIILAVPVDGIVSILNSLKNLSAKTTIIDLGSTKEKIVTSVPKEIRANLVAAHPMTGKEKFGPSAAVAELYKDAVVVLCDIENSGIHQQQTAVSILSLMHTKIVYMNAKDHDRHAAFISHLPHLLSFSLANSVLNQEDKRNILYLAAGGFRDMSRLSKGSPHMWEDIFRQNKHNLLESIEYFEKELYSFKKAIENDNWDAVKEHMQNGNTLYNVLD